VPDRPLFFLSANESRLGNLQWWEDQHEVRECAPDGPVIGRIYKMSIRQVECCGVGRILSMAN